MADREFEEFRQYFEQLPQHIKAPSNCYTSSVEETKITKEEAKITYGEEKIAIEEVSVATEEPQVISEQAKATSFEAALASVEPQIIREKAKVTYLEIGVSCEEPQVVGEEAKVTYLEAQAADEKIKAASHDNNTLPSVSTSPSDVLAHYDPDNIFYAGEFGIYYLLVPESRMATKRRQFYGVLKSRKRLTVLLGANMSGTEKLPLLVIGKSATSRCFRGVQTLPGSYVRDREAKLTPGVFENWLRELDEVFYQSKRSVVMVVNNTPAHPHLTDLKAITLTFLPLKSSNQPLEQGIIRQLKIHYKLGLLEKMSDCIRAKKNFTVSLLDALYRLRFSWAAVTPTTIINAFRSCELISFNYREPEWESLINSFIQEIITQNGLDIKDFNICVCADDDLETTDSSEADTTEKSVGKDSESDEVDDGDSESEPTLPHSPGGVDMRAAFETIQTYLQMCPEADEMLDHLVDIQVFCKQQNLLKNLHSNAKEM
ncbi:tigger transposable element-derived protein 4-like [Homarus americanus]|nr:tigger transposable element-derived protein 4-like [Homarus americanus]